MAAVVVVAHQTMVVVAIQPNTGNASSLTLTTPSTLPSSAKTSIGYVVINNPTTSTINGITYSITSTSGAGSSVIIDATSATSCASITAKNNCNLKLTIPAGTIAGSFQVIASTNNLTTVKSKSKATTTLATKDSTIIGVGQIKYTTISGADGIALNYDNTVVAGVVTGVVTSTMAGEFNNIALVESANGVQTPISCQRVISSNLGAGKTALVQGDTFSIILPVPTGTNVTQTIYVQTSLVATDGTITPGTTSNTSYSLTTTNGVGIVSMIPSAVYLTPEESEQEMLIYNDGESRVRLGDYFSSPNVEITGYESNNYLESGHHIKIRLRLKDTSVPSSNGGVSFDYKTGETDHQQGSYVEENIRPAGDTHEHNSPIVPVAESANLIAEIEPNGSFFTDTSAVTVSRQMSIKNKGKADAVGISITLPANFTISTGYGEDANEYCNITANGSNGTASISNTLSSVKGNEHARECKVMVTYNNSVLTPQTVSIFTFNYNTNLTSTIGISYKVTQQ